LDLDIQKSEVTNKVIRQVHEDIVRRYSEKAFTNFEELFMSGATSTIASLLDGLTRDKNQLKLFEEFKDAFTDYVSCLGLFKNMIIAVTSSFLADRGNTQFISDVGISENEFVKKVFDAYDLSIVDRRFYSDSKVIRKHLDENTVFSYSVRIYVDALCRVNGKKEDMVNPDAFKVLAYYKIVSLSYQIIMQSLKTLFKNEGYGSVIN